MNATLFNSNVRSSVLALTLTLLTSCSSMRWDPTGHHVSLEPVSSEYAEISEVYVHKERNGVAIFGKLNPRNVAPEIPPGHVHVTLVARNGAILVDKSIHYYRIGKILKRPQSYSFSATIPITPPEGSTIRLRFEGDP